MAWVEPVIDRSGGYYLYTDLNRVGGNVQYLADLLNSYSYTVSVSPKTDWAVGDIPTASQMTAYLADVSAIRAALAVWATTPATPADMTKLTFTEANQIEEILTDVEQLISNMELAWFYSNDLYAGEV